MILVRGTELLLVTIVLPIIIKSVIMVVQQIQEPSLVGNNMIVNGLMLD